MNIAEIVGRSKSAYAEEPAIVFNHQVYFTYEQLYRRVSTLAFHFRKQMGLQPGERIALVMENRPEYVEIMFAAWHAGLVAVPMNAKLHVSEILYILQNSDAGLCLTSDKLFSQLMPPLTEQMPSRVSVINVDDAHYRNLDGENELPIEPRDPDDLAWLFYTSGTTGKPKGAMQSHKNLYTMVNGFLTQVKPVVCGDAVYHGAPMSHGGGYYMLPFIANGGFQLIPESGGFNVPELVDLLRKHDRVSFFAAPTMVKRLIEDPLVDSAAVAGLDTIIYGGGPMYQAVLQQAHEVLGNKLVQIYGQGECPMHITVLNHYHHGASAHPRYKQRLLSVGLPHLGTELKIIDQHGRPVAPNVSGEITVRSDAVMLGYWRNESATVKAIQDNWLSTGDIGCLDNDGFLYLTDRSKDVIISGGTNIYPREVEEILLEHPHVSEVSVIGLPDLDWGEIVVACVAAKPNLELDRKELEEYCLSKMARFKRPKAYRFLNELPKNSTGKVLKTELRELCKP